LIPDDVVERPDTAPGASDPQLDKAVAVLRAKIAP
jgi:hypothetical protein